MFSIAAPRRRGIRARSAAAEKEARGRPAPTEVGRDEAAAYGRRALRKRSTRTWCSALPSTPALPLMLALLALPTAGCGPRPDDGAPAAAPEAPASADAGSDEAGDGIGATEPSDAGSDGLDRADRTIRAREVERFAHLEGEIVIDGSSTVFPITEAVAALFRELSPNVAVRVGVSGTGGGFAKFCSGRTDLSGASRPIKASERELCREHGVEMLELPVAFDGLSLVVHPGNDFCKCLTVRELRHLWRPEAEGRVLTWRDVRSSWPERPIHLRAPGRDSGTFDYFTSAVVGEEVISRSDFVGSEDDYLLAQDVARNPDSLGFFGFAYYLEYRRQLSLVAVDAGAGCVEPSEQTIAGGTYRPLSRPVFVYARAAALERREVETFLELYLEEAPRLVPRVGYVALPERAYALAHERLSKRRLGSIFEDGSEVGMSIEGLLEAELRDAPAAPLPPPGASEGVP